MVSGPGEDPTSIEFLLGASPRKAAAQISFVPSLLVALLVTGAFCLALATGGQGIG